MTAITGDAPGNVAFYTQTLGLRLVKKTVNQDDVSAYHLFYADAKGTPGSDVTFFDWPQTPMHRAGIPDIAPIALRVPGQGSLEWWAGRFEELQIPHSVETSPSGPRLAFQDPEGQRFQLAVGAGGGEPWDLSPVPAEHQIRGLHGVTLASARPEGTAALLTEVLGFRPTLSAQLAGGTVQTFEVGAGGSGNEVQLLEPAERNWARQGRGGVHHVAIRVADRETQEEWRQRILASGLMPTPVIDRYYFQSVYFREPGGNLFEIATDGPGFTADEPADQLGRHLALPPFLESQRQEIEAGLQPLGLR